MQQVPSISIHMLNYTKTILPNSMVTNGLNMPMDTSMKKAAHGSLFTISKAVVFKNLNVPKHRAWHLHRGRKFYPTSCKPSL